MADENQEQKKTSKPLTFASKSTHPILKLTCDAKINFHKFVNRKSFQANIRFMFMSARDLNNLPTFMLSLNVI